jgi:daunorubicin resistance ABC transporter ATP-binding subunit
MVHTGIHARGLRKSFDGTPVLRGVDVDVPPGGIVALLGRNGAGKSTTVRILATLLRPDAGEVRLGGVDALTDPARARAVLGLTAQDAAVDLRLTGRENLHLIGRLRHLRRRAARDRADELLAQLDLVDAADRVVATYSGGMRRRLDLAMSLLVRPQVLFVDEPTTGLDPQSRESVWTSVRNLAEQGTAVLLTTQYLEEADMLADRIVVVDVGRVVATGAPADLKAQVRPDVLRLELVDADRVARAAQLLGDRVLPGPGASSLDVPTDGSAADVLRLLAELDAAGIEVGRMTIDAPTLDEVFLELTGSSGAESAA